MYLTNDDGQHEEKSDMSFTSGRLTPFCAGTIWSLSIRSTVGPDPINIVLFYNGTKMVQNWWLNANYVKYPGTMMWRQVDNGDLTLTVDTHTDLQVYTSAKGNYTSAVTAVGDKAFVRFKLQCNGDTATEDGNDGDDDCGWWSC